MIGLVVATHGPLGEALLATVALIIGPQPHALAVSLAHDDSPDELRTRLAGAIEQAGSECAAVLLATDMYGGTPSNIGMTFLDPGRINLLTGVNLPMLLKFFSYRNSHALIELAPLLKSHARDGIIVASEVLSSQR